MCIDSKFHFDLYFREGRGDAKKTHYTLARRVTYAKILQMVAQHDHVFASYINGNRRKEKFEHSECVPMDSDNEHSENPADWKTPDDVRAAFPDVGFYAVESRNHMKEKDGKPPRPKYHYYFPTAKVTDVKIYTALKVRIHQLFPEFDANALDAARFFFGVENPQVTFYEGTITIDEFLQKTEVSIPPLAGKTKRSKAKTKPVEPSPQNSNSGVIAHGERNTTLSKYAGQVLKRYGDTEQARQLFDTKAAECEPPLEQGELDIIFGSAQKFLHDVVEKEAGYVSPEKYNAPIPTFVHLTSEGKPYISAPSLAALFAEEHPYKIVTGTGNSKLYLYEGGVYRHAADDEVEKMIAVYITDYNAEMLKPTKVTEALKDLYLILEN